jgi:integrase
LIADSSGLRQGEVLGLAWRDVDLDQHVLVRQRLRVVLFASVVVAVVLFYWAFQRRLIDLPSTTAVPSAATMLAGARDMQLTTHDGLSLGRFCPYVRC